ncbi:WhiB family transcriptional regulator [Nonomuraea sp. NPDC050202]|uniref:WhiB family transcriptional regulator n=1 Tax=Nonomuraea sp. NPDC050202 TaxID=3155035 RepID=UPI0033F9FE11
MRDWKWQEEAACSGENLVLFFGSDNERQPEKGIRERKAKEICAQCPVRSACLLYAISEPVKYGLWGGMNEDERQAERRRRMRHNIPMAQAPAMAEFKRCRACRRSKPVGEFSRNAKHDDGLSLRCRPCIEKASTPTWARSSTESVA